MDAREENDVDINTKCQRTSKEVSINKVRNITDVNFENNLPCSAQQNEISVRDSNEEKHENTESLPCSQASFKIPNTLPAVKKEASYKEENNELKKENVPELKYKEPWWSALPKAEEDFSFEVLKNGCIIATLSLKEKNYHVIGRLPSCDVVLEHPSISRYHAIVQYRGGTDGNETLSGLYLYDLGSTHGTIVNKNKIKAKTYYRLKDGFVIKFGGSSRLFIFQGPQDNEPETEVTDVSLVSSENETKIKVGQIFTDEEYASLKKVEKKPEESEGIDWGFGEDAEEEQIDSEKFQELYSGVEFKDPKKTLRGYYEREGFDLEYHVDETGPGHARVYHCRVRLPVDGPNGSAVYAEASITGRKRDAVRECANEACKMLDAYGLLRQSSHESRKKRERNLEEDDFYESDEDNFLDRTGTIEKKRLKRMRKAGKEKYEVDTHESLLTKLTEVQNEIQVLQKRIQDAEALEKCAEGDSLENFMSTMSKRMDKETKMKLKRKTIELRKEEEKIQKLVYLTRPADLPSLSSSKEKVEINTSQTVEPIISKESSVENGDNKKGLSVENNDEIKEKLEENMKTFDEQLKDEKKSEKLKSEQKTGFFTSFAVPKSTVRDTKISTTSSLNKEKIVKSDEKVETSHNREIFKGNNKLLRGTSSSRNKSSIEPKSTIIDEKCKNTVTTNENKQYTTAKQWEDANDPNFADWLPPNDQCGDGRTKLNEKYGY